MNEICFLSARELAAATCSGALSSAEVLEAHLQQIERVNPSVNAIVSLDAERAREAARTADEAYVRGEDLGPLHGIPVAFKDTHDAAGFPTTNGSLACVGSVAEQDELIVRRMRDAGVVPLGKTNVPEFAAGSHTFNRVFGTTCNPYDLTRSAGGSSGGAAASLASGMQALADGSDMGGSLRNPASFCNVVGLRPSPGRVPTARAEHPWQTLAVQGPMARSVADVALMLSVVAGPDPRAPLSISEGGDQFAAPLDDVDPTGWRIGWSPDLGGSVPVDPEVLAVLEPQLSLFELLGCHVERVELDFDGAEFAFRTLRAWQFRDSFGDLLNRHPELVKESLAWNIREGGKVTSDDLAKAMRIQGALFQRFRRYFDEYDVLLMPVSQVPAFDADLEYPQVVDGVAQHTYLDWMRSCYLISVTASPALSVPAGFTRGGLPVGFQIVGPYRAERRVLEIGHVFECANGSGRIRPGLAI